MAVQVGDTCKRGHKIEGDNVQYYKNRGVDHVRCRTCNQPPKQRSKKVGDYCKHGHLLDGPNLGERMVNGRHQIYCRACHRASVRKHAGVALSAEQVERTEARAYRRASDRADSLIQKGKIDSALNYIKLAKRADRAAEALHKKLDREKPNCADSPGPYIDYPEVSPPTPMEAYLMCQGCPVLLECARFASAYKPAVGVWGGEVYIDGRPVRD